MQTDYQRRAITCRLRILSPVHIGCDQVYEPTAFVLDPDAYELTSFDPFQFISEMNEGERVDFSEICKQGTVSSILDLYEFMRGKTAKGRSVKVCTDFVRHFEQTVKLRDMDEAFIRQELNRFEIARTAYLLHDGQPYLPGSAVKGALRTAYLNGVANRLPQKMNVNFRDKKAARKLEEDLLHARKIENDPFRLVKVSDFMPVRPVQSRIIYAVNQKKSSGEEGRGPYQILEVIEPGAEFTGEIVVEEQKPNEFIDRPIQFDDLVAFGNQFFEKEKEKEEGHLKKMDLPLVVDDPSDSVLLLRIGHHSGAECVTIDGYRDIKIMQGKGKTPTFEKAARTLWLTSELRKPGTSKNLRPFGWVRLWDESVIKRKEQEAQEKQMAEEARQKAEAERQAALEAMPAHERDLILLQDGNLDEKTVVDIFNRLGEAPEDKKKDLAKALKSYWQAHGKWSGKLSKKQKLKVGELQKVLEK